jgi:hypothetical protein
MKALGARKAKSQRALSVTAVGMCHTHALQASGQQLGHLIEAFIDPHLVGRGLVDIVHW